MTSEGCKKMIGARALQEDIRVHEIDGKVFEVRQFIQASVNGRDQERGRTQSTEYMRIILAY